MEAAFEEKRMGYPDRMVRSAPIADDSADEHAFRSSGIGRGSSSGATPERLFVSWHCSHGTVPEPTILVTTDSSAPVKKPTLP